jgi:hypothetical protein
MTTGHTLEWLHNAEHLTPAVAVRGPRALWEALGSRDSYQIAREAAAVYRDRTTAVPLNGRESAVRDIIDSFEKSCAVRNG